MLTQDQVDDLAAMGVHRYNHNLETARSYFPQVVSTHTWQERWDTLRMVRDAGMEVCCGGIVGMGETVEQRAEFAAQLAELDPHEVPLNFLNPRPGTPFGDLPVLAGDGRAADHRRVPAGAAPHHPAVRRRARDHPRRPGHPRRAARRRQRGHRRQLPDHPRPAGRRGPRPARRARDAGEGAQQCPLTCPPTPPPRRRTAALRTGTAARSPSASPEPTAWSTMFTLSGAHVFPLYDGAVKAEPPMPHRRRPARGRPRCSRPRPPPS